MTDPVRLEVADGIATITLAKPDRLNAMTRDDGQALIAAFDATDADDAVRSVIVTGEGRAFCAGADLSGGGFGRAASDPAEARDWGGVVTLRIYDSVKPVIAAINGAAVGFGATMLLPMDVRIASTDARFGFVFTRRGIVPESASSWFLPRLVGISQALDWCYSGRVFDADEALRGGLVRSLHAPGDLLPAARAIARSYAEASAPVSVALTRRMLWRMLAEPGPMAAHLMESRMIPARGASGDAREGIAAFMEKRAADFPDRVSAGLPEV